MIFCAPSKKMCTGTNLKTTFEFAQTQKKICTNLWNSAHTDKYVYIHIHKCTYVHTHMYILILNICISQPLLEKTRSFRGPYPNERPPTPRELNRVIVISKFLFRVFSPERKNPNFYLDKPKDVWHISRLREETLQPTQTISLALSLFHTHTLTHTYSLCLSHSHTHSPRQTHARTHTDVGKQVTLCRLWRWCFVRAWRDPTFEGEGMIVVT